MLFPHFSSKFAHCRHIRLSEYPSFLPQVSPSLLSQLLSYYVHLCPLHTLHGLSTPSSVTQDRKIIVMEDRQMRKSRKECGGSSAVAEGRQMKRGLCHCQRTASLPQTHTALSRSPILGMLEQKGLLFWSSLQATRGIHAQHPGLLAPLAHQNLARGFLLPVPGQDFSPTSLRLQLQTSYRPGQHRERKHVSTHSDIATPPASPYLSPGLGTPSKFVPSLAFSLSPRVFLSVLCDPLLESNPLSLVNNFFY